MIECRPITKEDLPEIALLEKECFSEPWSETALQSLLPEEENGQGGICAFENGVFGGYIGFLFSPPEGEVINLAVKSAFRRRGIAKCLLGALEQKARESAVNTLFLEVRESNLAARKCYEKAGFSEIGKRKGFYAFPRENAVLYRKNLNEI